MADVDWRVRARNCAETFLIAGTGGAIVGLAGVPAGYLSGALVAVAGAGLAGRPTYVPMPLMRLVLFSLGLVLGSAVTPATLHGMATWPLSIVVLALGLACIFAATSTYLRLVHGWDPLSALFASSPGALSQVMALAIDTRVDVPAIVIVQTVRVVILTIALPLGLTALGLAAPGASLGRAGGAIAPGDLVLLLAACAVGAFAFHRLRIPGGVLLGATFGSAVLHGSGILEPSLPSWLIIWAMIGVGAMTGSRFNGTSPRMLARHLLAALGAFAAAITVVACFVVLIAATLPFRPADIVMAFSPGAQDAMMILALAMQGAPVYVGAHHVARFIMVSMALPVMVRVFGGPPPRPQAARQAPEMAPDD